MLIACNTILLDIYVAVLTLLECDTHARAQTDNTAALGDIRLVSVVQLCSYLIKRQHRAMDLYLGASATIAVPASSQHQKRSGSVDSAACNALVTLDTATSMAMGDLKMEVQERLGRLQQTLCI